MAGSIEGSVSIDVAVAAKSGILTDFLVPGEQTRPVRPVSQKPGHWQGIAMRLLRICDAPGLFVLHLDHHQPLWRNGRARL